MPTRLLVLISLLATALAVNAAPLLEGRSAGQPFVVESVAEDLGVPWGLAFIDDTWLVITDRNGRAWRVNTQSGERQALSGLPDVAAQGQGGLLDVAVSPRFAQQPWLYFTYSKPLGDQAATTLARAQLNGSELSQWQDLLITQSTTSTSRHFGSRIAFDRDGHVFFGVGDRGERPNGQNRQNHAGSIMRLNLDGSVPSDNPFVGNNEALDEIWSYGHRNPQGLTFDALTGRLWEIEHGPRGGDEINLIIKGANYGWPVVSRGQEYWGPVDVGDDSQPGMRNAEKVYIPSIAPSSLVVYHGDAFPAWEGNLLAGALVLRHLNRVILSESGDPTDEERLLESLDERIRALAISPAEGWLYLSTDSGKLLRLRPVD
ncbi:dehydrogenase [Saccharospirillum sp. MSK14-1]|uniref:PQQ-dependent sugar dehydrogenase n=1 Tax=Saccharospirillum sp. MSK14-1 TaxID=1897632 RepID=UPI000D34F02B|nr:PQQ-dependent sugar dehydrogenase [Saccharospirillum sp. MSK14-1]PTY38100.1 dehydrogenase [Saccharospirillum sp. MSK14-1]